MTPPTPAPEVTISIGHIEVRAAPREPAAPPAAVPPRVSLEDFLVPAEPAAMSDYLAVGGVSAVLRSLLTNALTAADRARSSAPRRGITAISPDLIATGADEQPQLNLFMYYVSLNPALRNLDLPSINGQGDQISNPPLALNLHYLVSAYGASSSTRRYCWRGR